MLFVSVGALLDNCLVAANVCIQIFDEGAVGNGL